MTNTETDLSVKEAAEETGLSEHTLRYYERIGLLNPIRRSGSGHRRFSADDMGWINFLKCLRATGMPIEDMKRYMDYQRDGDDRFDHRLGLLRMHRENVTRKIRELQDHLGVIDYKIGYYSDQKETT